MASGGTVSVDSSSSYRRGFMYGVAAHIMGLLVALLILVAFASGCDVHDKVAGALTGGVLLDIVASGAVLVALLVRGGGRRTATLAGWATSLLPAAILVIAGIAYLATLPAGCPV